MKRFFSAMLASLVAVTPVLNAYPNNDISVFSVRKSFKIPDPQNLSYDEVMDLLALIESDSFEDGCSMDELDQVNRLISFLAIEGAAENEKIDVGISIASLFKRDYCQYAYWVDSPFQYSMETTIFRAGSQNIFLCKNWFSKQWGQTKDFVKKHKKAIIIGAIIVVTVTVVVVAAVAISTSAATGAAAGGIAASTSSSNSGSKPSPQKDSGCGSQPSHEDPLASSLQNQISSFKEDVVQQQLAAISESGGISIEENGRIIGSLFTHKTIDTLTNQAKENPFLDHELQDLGFNLDYPLPKWASDPMASPHISTDLAFSTNYLPAYVDYNADLNTLSYLARGDLALSSGYYTQAVQDFGRAIEIEPNNPDSYLGRGLANFELGHYEESVTDYNNYASKTARASSITDFSIGFAKGLPQGIYDSGEGMLLFITEISRHPIQTGEQVYQSISMLSSLAKLGEWNLIAGTLSPELHQLISEWDTLSARQKGELSGYAFGKHGADILLPGATVKAVAKGSSAAKELAAICKNLQSAEKILVLEALAEGGAAGVNVGKAIASVQKTIAAAEDFGLGAKEIATLKQAGELEQVVGKGRDFFAGNLELQASYDLFQKAKEMLEPYTKKPMPEIEVRNLIHQNGICTFQKPRGIPDTYLVKITEKGAGIEYLHPINEKTSVRVMPGMPHSPNLRQQKPYVVQLINNKAVDKYGNFVSPKSPEAHIPLDEFVYQEKLVYGNK